jgi:hypothetical protein
MLATAISSDEVFLSAVRQCISSSSSNFEEFSLTYVTSPHPLRHRIGTGPFILATRSCPKAELETEDDFDITIGTLNTYRPSISQFDATKSDKQKPVVALRNIDFSPVAPMTLDEARL